MSVVVLIEPDGDGAALTSLEAVTFARDLAAGAPVHAVVVGSVEESVWSPLVDQLAAYGVASVRHAEDERLSVYAAAAWAAALVDAATSAHRRQVVSAGDRAHRRTRHRQVCQHGGAPVRVRAVGVVHQLLAPGACTLGRRRCPDWKSS